MFTNREHVLNCAATYMILFYIKLPLKKYIFRQNLIEIYTTMHQIEHFLKIFLEGTMLPNNLSMCVARILLFSINCKKNAPKCINCNISLIF